MLHSELDARWPDVGTQVTQGRDKGSGGRGRNRGPLQDKGAMLGLAHTPSVITLGCLDEGDKRGGGQGLLLELTRLRARYGYCNEVESKR